MASPIASSWIHATVPVDNPQGESGTGFLVARMIDETSGRIFLVTNKHVIHREHQQRGSVSHVTCHFNTTEDDGSPGTSQGDIPLTAPDGNKRWRQHPDSDTDVYAIDVTDVINVNPKIQKKWVTYDMFADAPKRSELDITVGEEIITIGYPPRIATGEVNVSIGSSGTDCNEHRN